MNRRFKVTLVALVISLGSIALFAAETLHGNTSSKVYHQPSCQYYNCKNCTAEFASSAEAEKSGYKPCQKCSVRPTTSKALVAASFVGNTASKKFHRSSCRYASCKHCTQTFSTREAAINAGFVPGGCCNP